MSFNKDEFLSSYICPSCRHHWRTLWDSACDDTCPACGERDVSPYQYVNLDDERFFAKEALQEAYAAGFNQALYFQTSTIYDEWTDWFQKNYGDNA